MLVTILIGRVLTLKQTESNHIISKIYAMEMNS